MKSLRKPLTKLVDSHVHFWNYEAEHDDFSWIGKDMEVLKMDYLPHQLPILDLAQASAKNNVSCVAVQARQSEEEMIFLLKLADENPIISGVVGWIDWTNPEIETQYKTLRKQYKKLKGFRHIIQGEKQGFMLQPQFQKSIELLDNKFTYDLLLKPSQLGEALQLVELFPDQSFVIDHLAKPDFKGNGVKEWKAAIQPFERYKNVSCKLSGMVTEAHWKNWNIKDFEEALATALNVFGVERLMYGSDWPVCLLAANYSEVKEIIHKFFLSQTRSVQQRIFYKNAIKFYNL